MLSIRFLLCLGLMSLGPASSFSSSPMLHTSLTPQNPPPPRPVGVSILQTPKDFLLAKPPGPYTCLRARDLALLGFDFHIARLLHSIRSCGGTIEECKLRQSVLDKIEANLHQAIKSGNVPQAVNSFITVHVDIQQIPHQISVHSLLMSYAMMPPPITLEVRGNGRMNPDIKHSQWIWDRQELERYRLGAGGEVALCTEIPTIRGGREILEGLVTNIFAMKGGKLMTADRGVLKGHVREMVIESAKALGLEVVADQPLRLDEIHTWEEAFITGSGRILVPISRIEGTSLGLFPVELQAPGPITNQLRQRLLYDIDASWVPIDKLKAQLTSR